MPCSSDLLGWALARPALLLSLALAGAAGAVGVEGSGEPHLAIQPRSPEEIERIASATALPSDFAAPQKFEDKPAGAATVRARPGADAFSFPSGNMPFAHEMDFKLGNALFTREWVSSASSTRTADGIGPLFNARACQSCHTRDGRGHQPEHPQDDAVSIFLRLSMPDPDGETHGIAGFHPTLPDPTYGGQL